MAPCTLPHTLLRRGSRQWGQRFCSSTDRICCTAPGGGTLQNAPTAGRTPDPTYQCIARGQRGWSDPGVNWLHDPLNSPPKTQSISQLMGLGAIISSLENDIFLEAETGFSIILRTEGVKEGQTPGPGGTCHNSPNHRAVFTRVTNEDHRGGKPSSAIILLCVIGQFH